MSPEGHAIESLLRIVNKEQEQVDFKLNSAQRIIDESISGRDLYPKARREGVSMYFLARNLMKCLGVKNTVAVVISHEAKATQRMLDRINYFIDNIKCPKPVIETRNRNEITFPKTNSTFYIGTAGAKAFGRGDGITDLHCSEIAYWPDVKSLASGLFQAVARNGRISIESTGNGAGDYYHKMCMRAARGNGRYRLHFLPWHKFPEYNYQVSEAEAEHIMSTLSEEWDEPRMVQVYGLTAGQILFRREKLEELEYDLAEFNQEYPTTLDDCFQATGAGIFYRVIYEEVEAWRKHDTFLWKLDGHPYPGRSYVVGGDVSAGVGRDSSVLEVFDCETHEQVGEWISNRTSPDIFASHAATVGRLFNNAYMAIESNNHGIVTLSELKKLYPTQLIHKIPHLQRKPDEIARLVDLGTRVTAKSKAFIIGRLRKELAAGAVVHSPVLKSELSTFVEFDDGTMGAQEGSFDDCVMAAAHAMYVLDKASMITPEDRQRAVSPSIITDPFSIDAIIRELTGDREHAMFKEEM